MNASFSGPGCINILLVHDQQMMIEGIKTLLRDEADIVVVAQAGTGPEALHRLHQHPEVTLVIVDLNMARTAGVDLTRSIHSSHPKVRILALGMSHDHTSVTEVLQAGGAGYLLKNTGKEELCEAIRAVAGGRAYFSPEVGAMLLQHMPIPANGHRSLPAEQPSTLTARETQILQLIAREYSNYRIAEQLFISERTVETHRKNILAKTNSKSVVGLIQYALRHKLIS